MPGAAGLGGGSNVAGGMANINDATIAGNTAQGGAGGNGFVKPSGKTTAAGDGGDGFGRGLYAADGILFLHHVSVTENHALGRLGGTANPANLVGDAGKGIGGGLHIPVDAEAGLDQFTVDHVKLNDASTSHKNLRGTYELIL
jgi:hypothetical protein